MLKIATVPSGKVWPLVEHDQLIEFLEWQRRNVDDDMSHLIRNSIPVDRWDHCQYATIRAVVALALMNMQFGKSIPLMAFGDALREYSSSLFNTWNKLELGEILCVNMMGGFSTYAEFELSDIKEYHPDLGKEWKFAGTDGHDTNSGIIVIENDPELDPWYTENITEEFSYILSLSRWDKTQLTDKFREFSIHSRYAVNPTTLIVHTQGNSWEQIEDYIHAAKDGHIKNINMHPSIPGAESVCEKAIELATELGLKASLIK